MKKNISMIFGAILLVLLSVYIVYQDSLPPRTPHKIARLISNLSIPNNAKIITFEDQWNDFNGNGSSFIVLQLDDRSFDKVYQEAKSKRYTKLPISKKINVPLKDIFIEKIAGSYKIDIEDEATMSFNIIMLSSDDKKILVYISSD